MKLVAFAEIDWHEFAIVQTIEFTAADSNTALPAPMTIEEMESRALAEKRMTAMIMEDTAPDFERAREAAAAQAAKEAAIDKSEEEVERQQRKQWEEEERAREEKRARDLQARNLDGAAPMKIRKDYVAKSKLAQVLLLSMVLRNFQHLWRKLQAKSRTLLVKYVDFRFLQMNMMNICGLNCSIRDGRRNEMPWNVGEPKLTNCRVGLMFQPLSEILQESVSIFLVQRTRKSDGRKRRKKS